MQRIRLATFNLNNLFSRFDFRATTTPAGPGSVKVAKELSIESGAFVLRTFAGKRVSGKSEKERAAIASRIVAMNADVLAVQEVEDLDTLQYFNHVELKRMYPHVALIEGNDERLIDVGVLSKLPLGTVTSEQFRTHPEALTQKVFSRDLLGVEVMDVTRAKVLFNLYVTHLKSKYAQGDAKQRAKETRTSNVRRQRQAEVIAAIVSARHRAKDRFAVVGDMNDAPKAKTLAAFANAGWIDGLVDAVESTRLVGTPKSPWTHRFKSGGRAAAYERMDQIWLSAAMAKAKVAAGIERRSKLTGDGSDHDPAWVEVTGSN